MSFVDGFERKASYVFSEVQSERRAMSFVESTERKASYVFC
jgi:hypothetical protein